jgi:hypothetical protein
VGAASVLALPNRKRLEGSAGVGYGAIVANDPQRVELALKRDVLRGAARGVERISIRTIGVIHSRSSMTAA